MNIFKWFFNLFSFESKTECWLCEQIIKTSDAKMINGIFYCSDECYYDEMLYEKLASEQNEVELNKLIKKIESRVNFRKVHNHKQPS